MDLGLSKSRVVGLYTCFVVFVSIAITKSRQQDNFYFDPAPINLDVIEGESTELRCDVSNRKHISFYWTLNDKPVTNTSRRYQKDSNLWILRVSREDDVGSFRCIATNVTTGVSLRSTEARVNILWLDDIAEVQLRHPKSESHIAENNYINLKCHAEGNPEPEIEWYKNKIRLFSTGTERMKFHKNRLRINNITAEDNGVYSCNAKNAAGQVESSDNFLLNVAGMDSAHLNLATFTQMLLVRKEGRAQFNCQYSKSIITEWYFNEIRLTNTSENRATVYPNGTFVIRDVKARDKGIYKCLGLSENGPVQTFVSELVLAYLDDITPESFEPKPPVNSPKVVPINQKFEIRCFTPQGLPPPEQRWEDPSGNLIPEVGRIRVVDQKLFINSAQPSDSGNYSCVGENMAGIKKAQVWVVVSVPPSITRPPLSTRVQEGETAIFDCQVTGTEYPVTRVTWSKDGDPVDMTHPRFIVNQSAGTLQITNVHLLDEGNYACVVNTTGHSIHISTNAHLYVKKKLKFRPRPVNTKLELDSDSKVHCNAEGQAVPTVKWEKTDKQPFPDNVVDRDGVLFFSKVKHSDVGYYTCMASSSQGVINATIYIDVVVKPRIKVKPLNTTAFEGYPVMLHCVAVGEPNPTIQWDKNSKVNEFDKNRFRIMENGSLHVSEVYMEDMGKYGCTAGNSGGFEREEVYLHVQSGQYYNNPNGRFKEDSFSMMKTIIIAVCSAVAYLAVVIGLTVYCSLRLMKAKNLRKAALENAQPIITGPAVGDKQENGVIPNEHTELMDKKERDSSILKSDDARSHVSGVSSHHSHSSHSHHSSRRRSYDKLNFPRHDLQTLGMLGKGHYGDVFLAKAHGIKDGEAETLVVVKSLLSRDEQHHFEFRREIDMFGRLNHEHVTRLLGVCRDMEPQFIITEYCEWGDLKQFLWATRKDNIKRNTKLPPLTVAQKTTMCSQVALGMEHLANHRFIHKDLAARNILLTSSLEMKIASLGLCRDVYASEYFPFHTHLLPLRWMPPEALLEDEFSTKTDIWSYGILVWEIFTLGDLPYKKRTDEEVLKGLKIGDCILDPPPNCPKEMHELIEKCTADSPKDRPSFSEIALMIGEMQVDSDV